MARAGVAVVVAATWARRPTTLLHMATACDARIAALLFQTDGNGKRVFGDDEIESLVAYVAALDGRGSAVALANLEPPPVELINAVLHLARELRLDAHSGGLSKALAIFGGTRAAVPEKRKPIGASSALFARFTHNK